jgi:lysophospholipase L1-like esterase
MSKSSIYIIYFVLVSIFSYIHAQIDVVAMGNSITSGSQSTNPYPDQLGILLGTDYVVINYGRESTTILKNGENSYWAGPEIGWATGMPQDIVIITFGTNATRPINWDDYSNEFIDDYLTLIDEFNKWNNPDRIFVLGLPPPINIDGVYDLRNNILINEIIPKIKTVAKQTGATIADFYHPMDNHPEWFNVDGVHPNATGDSVMAQIVYGAIQKSQAPPGSPPETPTGLKTIPRVNKINLEWHANTEEDLSGYRIYRSDDPNNLLSYIAGVPSSVTNYSDNNVIPNKFYYYAIDAIDFERNFSKPTSIVTGKTLDNIPPSTPKNLQIILEADTIKINWTPNTEPDLEKYYIFRNVNLDDIQQPTSIIGTVNAPKSDFIDISYNSATSYYYGAKAVDMSGNQGTISNIVNIDTKSRPLSSDTTITFYEDIPHQFSASDFPFSDADNHSLDKIIFFDSDPIEYFSYDGENIDSTIICENISKLLFASDSNEYGDNYATFTFKVIDSFGSRSIDTNKIIINVASVNDAPHIDPISDLYVIEDSNNIIFPITGIYAGPVNEIQNLSVKVFADDTSLVNVSDIQYNSPDDTGFVTIDPVENIFGILPITVQIIDDGGSSNGGVDSSETTFYLNISPINDPPIFNLLDDIQIIEDSETIIELTGIQAGPWETDQQITMSVKSNNTDILPYPELNYNSPDTTATLTISTIPNIFGSSSITITMSDNGGTDFGGNDSTSYIIPVEISSVNDAPSDFNIITPISDSTIVINKSNYLNTFSINWEVSSDIENNDILYDIIFGGDLSALSRYNMTSTNIDYVLKEILAVTDTISIANSAFSIIASDGDLQTDAKNSGIAMIVDGRSFAPAKLHLDQNYPNPFNHTTLIGFDLPKRTNVSIIIYDLLGEEIIKLIDNVKYDRGYNTITWNGLDKNNNVITTGIYIMQINMGSKKQNKKLIFLK